jgi:hypothetical protein
MSTPFYVENNSEKIVFEMVFWWVPDFNYESKLGSKLGKIHEKIIAHRHRPKTSPHFDFSDCKKNRGS